MSNQPRKPTRNQKKAIIEPHLSGEIEGLIISFRLYQKGKIESDGPLTKIAYESFLLHTRNLIEFFSNMEKEYGNAVRIGDFIEDSEKQNKVIDEVKKLKAHYYQRLHKQLNHITYDRLNGADQIVFDVEKIYYILHNAIIKYNNLVENHFQIKGNW